MSQTVSVELNLIDNLSKNWVKAEKSSAKHLEGIQRTAEKAARQAAVAQEKAARQSAVEQEKREREKTAIMRNSLALQDRLQSQAAAKAAADAARSSKEQKAAQDTALRTKRQAAIAEANLVTNRFDRLAAIERTRHAQSLAALKGNDAAQEAERRRHNAAMSRIGMDRPAAPAAAPSIGQNFVTGLKGGLGVGGGMGNMALMAGGAMAATLAITSLTRAIGQSVEIANRMNTVTRSLSFAMGGVRAGAEEFEYVRRESDRLGTSLLDSAQSFAQLAAAARGTTLEGEGAREIFKGISEAAITLGLSGEQTAGALNAIQQMVSKGTVQAEELRGQLGERLPGAFQIASRAMGVSTRQLGKMLELGQVMADDFLPKFAVELQKTYGETAVKASGEARASISRMNNTIMEGASIVGEVAVGSYGLLAKAFLFVRDNTLAAAAAQEKYYAVQMGGVGTTGQAAQRAADEARILAFAKGQDKMDRLRQNAEQKADDQRSKDLAAEDKERKKAGKAAEDEAKRLAEEMEMVSSEARMNSLKREAKDLNETAKLRREAGSKSTAEKLAADERNTSRIYSERQKEAERLLRDLETGAMRDGPAKKMAESEGREQDEVAAFKLNTKHLELSKEQREQAITNIERRYSEERKQIKQAESEIELTKNSMAIQSLQNLANATMAIAGKNKALFAFMQALALAEIAVNTWRAVMADNANPLTAYKVPYDIALGATAAAAVAAQTIAGFKDGGYTGSGPRDQVAGMVHREEYVVKAPLVDRLGGPRGVEAALSGRGGGNKMEVGGMHFYFGNEPSKSTIKEVGDQVNSELRKLAGQLDEIENRNIRRSNRG